jgi:hypothetical protein
MIRGLPEEARWTSKLAEEIKAGLVPEPEFEEQDTAAGERSFWTPDRQLIALLHNAIVQNTQLTGMWKEAPPDLPLLGPESWHQGPDGAAKPVEPQPGDEGFMQFHLARLGMPLMGGRV